MLDLILYNARIYTQCPDQPWAQALGIQNGRIIILGNDQDVRALRASRTQLINAHGRLVLPSFTDAHIHLFGLTQQQGHLALYHARSMAQALGQLRVHASRLPEGAWALGYGWNETLWPEHRFPTRFELDAVTGPRPALLWRTDLHVAVANSAALKAANITAQTPDPPAGIIDRDEHGEPTGVLRELAICTVLKHSPRMPEQKAAKNLKKIASQLHQVGITSVHDQRLKGFTAGGTEAFQLYQQMAAQDDLPLRISVNFETSQLQSIIDLGMKSGCGDEWVRFGHVKLFADGSLGAHTACMLSPYEDTPNDAGLCVTSPEEMAHAIQQAHRNAIAVSVHAIGDRANRIVLDIFEETLRAETPNPPALPHRIEHVQIIQPQDQPRLAALGLTASMQPLHCTDDIPNAERYLGERGRNAYPFRSLLDVGTVLAFGSDAPVADPNPWLGIHAAVTRQRVGGEPEGGWYPEQRISVAEAVQAYTLGPAQAIGQAHQQGRLAQGYLADLIMLDRNIFEISPAAIADTRVLLTMLGGKVIYEMSSW